jgi:hypothetical protein
MHMSRRGFLAYGVGMLAAMSVAMAQQAVLEKGKAVSCDSNPVKCPNGHDLFTRE